MKKILLGDSKMKNGQIIKCNVYSCKYCNCDSLTCMLNEIKVSNSSNNMKKEGTMCSNYKKQR